MTVNVFSASDEIRAMFDAADSDFSTDSVETGGLDLEVDDIAADDIAGYRDILADIAGEYLYF